MFNRAYVANSFSYSVSNMSQNLILFQVYKVVNNVREVKTMRSTLREDELRSHVLAALAQRVPWNVIAKKYHVSPKTISKFRKEDEATR